MSLAPKTFDALFAASRKIRQAEYILVVAGAGMGFESGLPDLGGPNKFWNVYSMYRSRGLRLDEVSTPHWFDTEPHFAWGFFGHSLNLYRAAVPHHGFSILRKWAAAKNGQYFIYTSNVDGLFQKAGFPEDKIVECQGSMFYMQALNLHRRDLLWPLPPDFSVNVDENTMRAKDPLPSGLPDESGTLLPIRPNILMFKDYHWVSSRYKKQLDRCDAFMDHIYDNDLSCVVLEIGAGTVLPRLRIFSERYVKGWSNRTLVRINPAPELRTPEENHIILNMGAVDAFNALDLAISSASMKEPSKLLP